VWKHVDVVLASYPKCGRTWFRFQIANYLNLSFNTEVDMDLNNMFAFVPNWFGPTKTLHASRWLTTKYSYRNIRSMPLISATHEHPSDLKLDGKKVIFLTRDPKDTFLSRPFESSVDKGSPAFINTLRTDPAKGIMRYCLYMNSWADQLKHLSHITLSYESLKRDTEGELRRVLGFVGVPLDTTQIRQAVSLASIENMKRLELERGLAFRKGSTKKAHRPPRVNRGVVGRGKKVLCLETQAFIDQCLDISLTDEAKLLLKANDPL